MYFREFLHTVPFIRLLLPFTLGIVSSEFFVVDNWLMYTLISLSFLSLLIFQSLPSFRKTYSYSFIYGIFIFLFCLSSGYIRVNHSGAKMTLPSVDSITAFKGSLKRSPDEKAKSMACVIELKGVYNKDRWEKANAQVLLYLAKDSLSRELEMGDDILVSSKLEKVSNNGNPNEFDYAKYLQHRYILYSTYVRGSSWKLIEKNKSFNFKHIAVAWRQRLLNIYKKAGLKNEAYEILAALTLGAREEVSEDVKSVWSAAGATHVLAVSGLHVGIIFGVMQFLLSFLAGSKFGRFFRGVLLLACLWSYALLTGLSPSVMRAASMFSILAIALMINRKGTIYNSLAISALLLLLINPFVLFDVGFQFSYLAVVSIVYFQPKFENMINVNTFVLRWSWRLFTVSLAAQIGTFPLAIYYFHQFPAYFFLSNFVIIPVAGLLIYSSALLLIFSEIDFITKWFTYLLQHFVELIHGLIYQIQALPGALVERITFTSLQVVLLYGLIIGLTFSIFGKRKKALFVSLIILIAFQLINISDLYQSQSSELLVFNVHKQTVICIRDGQSVLVLSDTLLNEKQKNRLVYPYAMAKGVKNYSYEVLKENELRVLHDKTIAIMSSSALNVVINNLQVDYLILRNNAKGFEKLVQEFKGTTLIRDASNYAQKFRKLTADSNTQIWDTRRKGSFRIPLSVD
ncbi:ComEC/Rec2 family competence protein [Ancylomarina sp.]|uniref:ComEC/Rec2 family competence protein n=1 Tax=Ancylomarina sp. TaxID=1970196 RepID=UPI003563B69B